LVSRRLDDKNESLGLGLGLEEKVLQFFKTVVVILDGTEQGIFNVEYCRDLEIRVRGHSRCGTTEMKQWGAELQNFNQPAWP